MEKLWVEHKTLFLSLPRSMTLLFSHQKQYPLKPEFKEELKHIIEDLKEQGLLIPSNSPYNTPLLAVKESIDKWRLVQDLRISRV